MKQISFFLIFCVIHSVLSSSDFLKNLHQTKYVSKLERGRVLDIDHTYMEIFEMKTFKYNRTQIVLNVTMQFMEDVGDVNFLIQSFKLSRTNAFRAFPMTFFATLCEIFEYDVLGLGSAAKKSNFTCPFKKNIRYHIGNFVANSTLSPPFVPTGEYKEVVQMFYGDKNIAAFEMYDIIQRPILSE